ncbi:MAG: hypothetical protein ABFE13_09300 [Phycisphaerales bacterium]
MNRTGFVSAFAAVLIPAQSVCADLMPFCQIETGRKDVQGCDRKECEGASSSGLFARGLIPHDLHPSDLVFLPETEVANGMGNAMQGALNLTEASGSLGYCLYAFLGLGLCQSGHWVKKTSLCLVHEWCPYNLSVQIDRSPAVSPDAFCFIPSDSATEHPPARPCPDVVASFWLNPQFALAVLAPRGPPAPSA